MPLLPLILALTLGIGQPLLADADGEPGAASMHADLVRKASLDDVQTTMDRLETLVLERGLELHGRFNLGKDANKAGVSLADAQLILFGNPNTLGLVMSHDMEAGLELPLRILVYSGKDGNTWVQYREPLSLRQSYRLHKCTAMEDLSHLMAELAEAAVNGD